MNKRKKTRKRSGDVAALRASAGVGLDPEVRLKSSLSYRKGSGKGGIDALDRRYPGSFGAGKKR